MINVSKYETPLTCLSQTSRIEPRPNFKTPGFILLTISLIPLSVRPVEPKLTSVNLMHWLPTGFSSIYRNFLVYISVLADRHRLVVYIKVGD